MTLQASGLWMLAGDHNTSCLRLTHAWPAFAWMALRFLNHDAADAEALEFTVSKRSLTDDAWRELRICVARQQALSYRPAHKEGA